MAEEGLSPRYGDVYELPALMRAFRRARRAKRGRGLEPAFYFELEANLLRLSEALRSRRYVPDPIRYFELTTGALGKRRTVSEASFRDRVVHQSLVRAIEPVFERRFIEHSYAGRRGRGLHAAVVHVQRLAARHADGYFLRLDVQAHFEHIDHEILLSLLADRIDDEGILWLCRTLLSHAAVPSVACGEGRGLPIGNLTSQLWANVVLDRLDHHVRDRVGVPTWTRYMDDMLVVVSSEDPRAAKRRLWEIAAEAGDLLRGRLGLRLKPSATRVAPVRDGIPWLGLRIFPGLVRLSGPARGRLGRKLRRSAQRAVATPCGDDLERARAASIVGYAANADSLSLCRDIIVRIDGGWRSALSDIPVGGEP